MLEAAEFVSQEYCWSWVRIQTLMNAWTLFQLGKDCWVSCGVASLPIHPCLHVQARSRWEIRQVDLQIECWIEGEKINWIYILWCTDAIIGDGEANGSVIFIIGNGNPDDAAGVGKLERVVHELHENLLDLHFIREDLCRHISIEYHFELQLFYLCDLLEEQARLHHKRLQLPLRDLHTEVIIQVIIIISDILNNTV